MTHEKTGGPAFPQHSVTLSPDGVTLHEVVEGGMTLRDWFAGQAAINQNELSVDFAEALMGEKCPDYRIDLIAAVKWWATVEAKLRLIKADAMLAAREAKP